MEQGQRAGSARQFAAEYNTDRRLIGAEIRAGRLPASRLGLKKFLILRADFERWLASKRVRPDCHGPAEAAARRLAKESARAGPEK